MANINTLYTKSTAYYLTRLVLSHKILRMEQAQMQRDILEYDVAIIGGGPAGLAAAIRFRQLDTENQYSICVVEKSAQIGGHNLAGAVMEPRALDELLPDWREKATFPLQEATQDKFMLYGANKATRLPTPPQMHNKGNYIISLAMLCRFLGEQAEAMNIDVLPGFAAQEALVENNTVVGVRTGDFGVNKDGKPGDGFVPGPDLKAKVTLFSEGCRGHITKSLKDTFKLDEGRDPQTYALGMKEIWRVTEENHKAGYVEHTMGWPLDSKTYGGGWIYHLPDGKISIGFVTGLDYANPKLAPHAMMQKFKTHPRVQKLLEGGELLHSGGRALYEGGAQSQYKLAIPGALFVGDTAGFLNVPKIKGIHTAMKSGMLGAESTFDHLQKDASLEETFPNKVQKSWLGKELHKVRNIRPGFNKGMLFGLMNAGFETLTMGKTPWTLHNHADYAATAKLDEQKHHFVNYDTKNDKVIDKLTGVSLTNTAHNENQPAHLKIIEPDICISRCTEEYGNPCTQFCPANVYEIVDTDGNGPQLQINASNCIHCKTCDIKDPYQVINWVAPEGGSGPNYTEM